MMRKSARQDLASTGEAQFALRTMSVKLHVAISEFFGELSALTEEKAGPVPDGNFPWWFMRRTAPVRSAGIELRLKFQVQHAEPEG